MRALIVPLLAAALVSCDGGKPATPAGSGGGGASTTWLTSFDEGLAQAKSSGKPLLVDFGAPW